MAFKTTTLIFTVVMASLIMAGFGIVISDIDANYDVEWNNETALFDKLNETYIEAETLKDNVNSSTTEVSSGFDVLGQLVLRGFEGIKLTFTSLGNSMEMTNTAAETIGLPKIFISALLTLILVFVIVGVIIRIWIKAEP